MSLNMTNDINTNYGHKNEHMFMRPRTYVHWLTNICSQAHEPMFRKTSLFRGGLHALRYIVLLMMVVVGVGEMWGQDDYSGIYYIANGKQLENSGKYYDKNNPSVNFYICPALYYYNPEGSGATLVSTTNDTGKPFVTTYQTNQGDNSIWIIEKIENKSTYYIKHIGVGDEHDKYLIKNPSLKSSGLKDVDDTRLRVHLEEKAKSELDADAEFEIVQYGSDDNIYYGIRISTITNGWLNPSKGNKQAYVPDGTAYFGGIISYYANKMPNESGGEGSKWYLEKVPPAISYNSSNLIEISYIDGSATIYYSYGEDSTPSPSAEGTFSYSETGPFDPPTGTTTIKAIAIKDGKESGVATFTPTFLLGSTHKYLIQAQGNGWATGDFQGNHYYMIPGDLDNGITKVNTTSMLRPSMQWYLLNAGDNYYYIVNNADNARMRYNTTNGVHMDTWDDSNANEFKFKIVESTAGTYNIIPYNVTGDYKYLNKTSGNSGAGVLILHNSATDVNSRWKFVPQDTPLADTPPFTPSGASTSVYYKIRNGNGTTTFHITPPISADGNVTASTTDDATVSWYFMQVEDPTAADWLAYYKIINAGTGKALYYAYTADNSPCLKVGDYDGNDDNYKFAFVKSPTLDYYYIVPKSHKDDQLNNISTFYRDGSNIKPATTRAASGNVWKFIPADLFCNDPEFVEEGGVIKIKCTTNAAKIYINTESNADPTSGSTLYDPTDPNNAATQNWATTGQVRIKAIASVSDGTTPVSSNVVTLLNKPNITLSEGGNAVTDNTYTYDGTAKQPDVSEVSIGEAPNKTTATAGTDYETVIASDYSNNTNAGTAKVTLSDKASSVYVWHAEKEFTINRKAVTITADDKTISYGEEPVLTATVDGLIGGDNIDYVLSDNYEPGDDCGTYNIIPSDAVSQNYTVTAYNTGTLTITQKALNKDALGTPADGITIRVSKDTSTDPATYSVEVTHDIQGVPTPLTPYDAEHPEESYEYTLSGKPSEGGYIATVTANEDGNYTGFAKTIFADPKFWDDRTPFDPGETYDPDNPDNHEYAAVYQSMSDLVPNAGVCIVKAYIVKKVNPTIGTITISPVEYVDGTPPTKVNYIPEGVPVLLLSNDENTGGLDVSPKDESTPSVTDAFINSNQLKLAPDEPSNPSVQDSPHGVAVKDAEAYVFYRGEFVLTKEGTISPGKFFLYNPNYTPSSAGGGGGGPSGVRRYLRIVVEENEDPDSMSEELRVESEGFATAKGWYTLDGRRLDGKPTRKGIYITNGKKMYFK